MKIFKIIPILTLVLLFSVSYAQEEKKMTEEEARLLIEEYNKREADAKAKIDELNPKLEALRGEIAILDEEIAKLEEEIAEKEPEKEKEYYVVKKGDWLSKLAEYPAVYGKGNYAMWPKIYRANKELIKDPDLIYPNWKLKIPR